MAWTYPVTGANIFNPVVIDAVMCVPAGGGVLAALDAATGNELRMYSVPDGCEGLPAAAAEVRSCRARTSRSRCLGERSRAPDAGFIRELP